jgi:hypothetical protein
MERREIRERGALGIASAREGEEGRGVLSVIEIWTKSLARRTLSRVRGTDISSVQHLRFER